MFHIFIIFYLDSPRSVRSSFILIKVIFIYSIKGLGFRPKNQFLSLIDLTSSVLSLLNLFLKLNFTKYISFLFNTFCKSIYLKVFQIEKLQIWDQFFFWLIFSTFYFFYICIYFIPNCFQICTSKFHIYIYIYLYTTTRKNELHSAKKK